MFSTAKSLLVLFEGTAQCSKQKIASTVRSLGRPPPPWTALLRSDDAQVGRLSEPLQNLHFIPLKVVHCGFLRCVVETYPFLVPAFFLITNGVLFAFFVLLKVSNQLCINWSFLNMIVNQP